MLDELEAIEAWKRNKREPKKTYRRSAINRRKKRDSSGLMIPLQLFLASTRLE
jgi:hypothetical protein